jgi:membrane fusion protein, multidrug efflux system
MVSIADDQDFQRQKEEADPARLERRGEAGDTRRPVDQARQRSWRDRIANRPLAVAAAAIITVLLVIGGVVWWQHARQFESTDDAFIDARTAAISAQVSGAIVAVPVADNQLVSEGDVLVQIDQRDYQAALAQAKAQVDQATANVANFDAQIDAQAARIEQAKDQVTQAEASLTFARQDSVRAQKLFSIRAASEQNAQQSESNLRQGEATLAAARANATVAEKQIAVLRTQRENAVGQLEQARAGQTQAETNLSRARITAPFAGRVTKLSAAKGAYSAPGQALMMFVPHELWITANYKETQLADMRAGQQVDIRIDAYPGRSFAGQVDSIQAGSGAAFSLLPAENAMGNYVKVVQRVPVKIVFTTNPDVYLGPGMSVVPSVKVR